jgi:hypothetical protein
MVIHLRKTNVLKRQVLQPFYRCLGREFSALNSLQKFQNFFRIHDL